jgi:hypothetical protein
MQADDPWSVKLFLHTKRIARMLKLRITEEAGERSVSYAVRAHSQETLGRCGCFIAAPPPPKKKHTHTHTQKPLVHAKPKA